MMILPLVTYCSIAHLQLTTRQAKTLESLQQRASIIISNNAKKDERPVTIMKKHEGVTVKKCLEKEICENDNDYFEINQTTVRTGNQGLLLQFPQIGLESTKKSLYFSCAKKI